jgi:Photosynthetic reaction centre cytochrome C subunit
MKATRKGIVISALSLTVICSVAATEPAKKPESAFKNLKVLPKNISQKQLSAIMVDQFQDELGVSCNFCHSENKETHKPDYASDEKPEKQIARLMMQMTNGINRKYFKQRHAMIGDSTSIVSCGTCHQGKPRPENF